MPSLLIITTSNIREKEILVTLRGKKKKGMSPILNSDLKNITWSWVFSLVSVSKASYAGRWWEWGVKSIMESIFPISLIFWNYLFAWEPTGGNFYRATRWITTWVRPQFFSVPRESGKWGRRLATQPNRGPARRERWTNLHYADTFPPAWYLCFIMF